MSIAEESRLGYPGYLELIDENISDYRYILRAVKSVLLSPEDRDKHPDDIDPVIKNQLEIADSINFRDALYKTVEMNRYQINEQNITPDKFFDYVYDSLDYSNMPIEEVPERPIDFWSLGHFVFHLADQILI